MLKFFHNDRVSLVWALAVEIVVHLLFASQAFLLGSFLGEVALSVIFGPWWGVQIGAWVLAIFIFGASFQAFVLGEYMQEHVLAFENTDKGNGSYIHNWRLVRWLVAAIEVSSLLFRLYVVWQDGNGVSAIIIGIMGLVLLWYAFAQAKVIHASVNRPSAYDVMMARERAGKSIVTDSLDYISEMSIAERQRFYNGDASAIDDARSRRNEKLETKESRKRRQREQEERRRREYEDSRAFADNLLGGGQNPR